MWTQAYIPLRSVPYPPIGQVVPAADWSVDNLALRPFGILAQDLEVDFTAQRPSLETQVLRCCTQGVTGRTVPEEFFWSLQVSERTHCLLIIAALDSRETGLNLDLRCPYSECGEPMEIDLSLQDIVDLHQVDTTDPIIMIHLGRDSISLRRPTGRDQLTWLSRSFSDEGSAARIMARTLVVDDARDVLGEAANDDWLVPVGEALAAADPLVDFTVNTSCPSCGAEATHRIDLGALALQRLQVAQDRLLAAIHTLASRYHWSEEQIMALPSWRRSHYLALVEREDGR